MGQDLAVGRWICDRARATPERTAIEWAGGALSYRRLHAESHRVEERLAGLGPTARVAVLAGNCPEYVAVVFGCALAGLVVVPLNWRQSPAELAFQLADSGAAALVAEAPHAHLAAAAASAADGASRPSGGGVPRLVELARLADFGAAPHATDAGADACPAARRAVRDDAALFIMYTSGTTGRPKGAVLSHANVFWANVCFDRMADVTSGDVVLQVLPQFHVGGWNCQPMLAWWKGATVVLERAFEPARVLRLVAERRVTTMMGVPATYQFLAADEGFDRADLSSLRYVLVGGAPMPESLLGVWTARGVRIVQGYGLTEASPNVLCLPAEDATRRLGFAGKPYPHVDVALEDPATGVHLDGAACGELLVRGPNVFSGYWRNDGATREALRGGWLQTGDVAERDAEGFYRIRDRLKDMYISGGENVYPAEVETVLAAHPAVAEAAVVPVPDDRWGEAGLAVIVVRPGWGLSEKDAREWCASRLGGYKVPREYRFVDALPRSAMNKVSKSELRERFSAPGARAHGPGGPGSEPVP
jgi:fatty-acyl-CoA synthase